MRLALLSCVVLWIGAARWCCPVPVGSSGDRSPNDFVRMRRATRRVGARSGLLSVESFRDVIGTADSRRSARRLARLFGVDEDAATRLEARPFDGHESPSSESASSGGPRARSVCGALLAAAAPPPAVGVLFVLGPPC